jgi:predicted NBD/HSP70 family sugar kinase
MTTKQEGAVGGVTVPATDGRGPVGGPRETRPRGARPGTPSLLRELNDRAALELLLPGEPLTRAQLAEATGVSKVTVAQMLTRLEDRGLVYVSGEVAGGRGPNAALYSVVPSSAYVAALYVESGLVATAVADVTGRVIAEVRENPEDGPDPVELIRGAVDRACRKAGVSVSALSSFVIGTPGVVDPSTGDPRFAINLPAWHEGVLAELRSALRRPVVIENDVNLAAMAERSSGAAVDVDDFVLVWIGVGLGLATVLGGQLHRGAAGAAGEIGYLPVPGAPVSSDVRRPADGGLQWLAGADAVRVLAGAYGFAAPSAGDSVRAAVAATAGDAEPAGSGAAARAQEFLGELAHRVAAGVASVCAVLDPGLVVLGGEVGQAGGTQLAELVAAEVTGMCPARPRVVPTEVPVVPVLCGALQVAVDHARADLLASVGT